MPAPRSSNENHAHGLADAPTVRPHPTQGWMSSDLCLFAFIYESFPSECGKHGSADTAPAQDFHPTLPRPQTISFITFSPSHSLTVRPRPHPTTVQPHPKPHMRICTSTRIHSKTPIPYTLPPRSRSSPRTKSTNVSFPRWTRPPVPAWNSACGSHGARLELR